MTLRPRVAAVAAHTPGEIVDNDQFVSMGLDTSDEWVRSRTGIAFRRFVRDESVSTSDLGAEVLRMALERAGWEACSLDAIVCATSTPEGNYPATATAIQAKAGAHRAFGIDVTAACTGFVAALSVASGFVATEQSRRVAVVAAELNNRILDFSDRNTSVLFGDGAGCLLLEAQEGDRGVLGSALRSDGRLGSILTCPQGGPIRMDGKAVYRCAVTEMPAIARELLQRLGVDLAEVDLLVPHQANIRILQSTAESLGISPERVMINVQDYGNTSAASIPIALAQAESEGRLGPGSLVLLLGVGAGMIWGANLVRW